MNFIRYVAATVIGDFCNRITKFFQINRMHPEFWSVSSNEFISTKFDRFVSCFPKFTSREPQTTSENCYYYCCDCCPISSSKKDTNTFTHNEPPKTLIIPLLGIFIIMGFTCIAYPFLDPDEGKKRNLIIGFGLIFLGIIIGLIFCAMPLTIIPFHWWGWHCK